MLHEIGARVGRVALCQLAGCFDLVTLSLVIDELNDFRVVLPYAQHFLVRSPSNRVLWEDFVECGGRHIFSFRCRAQIVIVDFIVKQQIIAANRFALVEETVELSDVGQLDTGAGPYAVARDTFTL